MNMYTFSLNRILYSKCFNLLVVCVLKFDVWISNVTCPNSKSTCLSISQNSDIFSKKNSFV